MSEKATLQAIITADNSQFNKKMNAVKNLASSSFESISTVGKFAFGAVATVTAAATVAATAYISILKKTANQADLFYKESQKMGISIEDYSKLAYAADKSGIGMDKLKQATLKANDTIINLNKTANTGLDIQLFLARSQTELLAMPEFERFAYILELISKKYKENKTEALAFARAILGSKAGAELLPLINSGQKGLNILFQEAVELNRVFSSEFGQSSEKLNDNIARIKDGFLGIAKQAVEPLVGMFADVLDPFIEKIKIFIKSGSVHKYMAELMQSTKKFFEIVLPLTADLLNGLMKVVSIAEGVKTSVLSYGATYHNFFAPNYEDIQKLEVFIKKMNTIRAGKASITDLTDTNLIAYGGKNIFGKPAIDRDSIARDFDFFFERATKKLHKMQSNFNLAKISREEVAASNKSARENWSNSYNFSPALENANSLISDFLDSGTNKFKYEYFKNNMPYLAKNNLKLNFGEFEKQNLMSESINKIIFALQNIEKNSANTAKLLN